jgi:hypothetical protein
MLEQVQLQMPNQVMNRLGVLNVKRIAQRWWNGRQMDAYIGKVLDERYSEYRSAATKDANNDKADANGARGAPASTKDKSVMAFAFRAYSASQSASSSSDTTSTATTPTPSPLPPPTLDPHFRALVRWHVRLFIFDGHDSTSSSIRYMLYLLATHPPALARVRAEHTAVFGRAAAPAAAAVQPHHHPRDAAPLPRRVHDAPGRAAASGARYPTAGAIVLMLTSAMQRMPQHWARPDDCVPERWLDGGGGGGGGADDSDDDAFTAATGAAEVAGLAGVAGAWRPFGDGAHNCPGQALVLLEMRVLLLLLAREFAFAPAYAEWDAVRGERFRQRRKGGVRAYRGERAYQIEKGAAHPADRCPFRVAFNHDAGDDEYAALTSLCCLSIIVPST